MREVLDIEFDDPSFTIMEVWHEASPGEFFLSGDNEYLLIVEEEGLYVYHTDTTVDETFLVTDANKEKYLTGLLGEERFWPVEAQVQWGNEVENPANSLEQDDPDPFEPEEWVDDPHYPIDEEETDGTQFS